MLAEIRLMPSRPPDAEVRVEFLFENPQRKGCVRFLGYFSCFKFRLFQVRLAVVGWLTLTRRGRFGFAEDYAGLRQIVGRNLHTDTIPGNNSDEVFSHLAGDMSEHDVPVGQFQPEHRARQDIDHNSLSNNRLFFSHRETRLLPKILLEINPSRKRSQSLASFLVPRERRVLHLTQRADA